MPPTLASLVHHSTLKLTVRAGEGHLETPVRWAHVSELADPVPYMEGGELLLITAMTLDTGDQEAMRRYVRRLAKAGVVGLGFAVGVHYEDIPPLLVAAAEEEGLPLLEVPRRTPFLAISKAVSAAIAADQYRSVTAGFEAQRELTRAALSGDGPGDLLVRLASHVNGWAALYDAAGTVVAVAPEWAARRAARLTSDVARLGERPAPASAVVGGSDDRVELQSLGTGRRPHGALAVGTGAPLGTAERYAVHSAIALLTLTTERSRSLRAAEDRLGAAVLRMLLAGEPDHARTVAGDLYNGLLDAPYRLLIAEGTSGALQELAESLEAGASRAGEMVLVVPEGERLVVLATDGGAAVTACTAYAQRIEAGQAQAEALHPAGAAGAAGSAADDDQVVIGQSAPAGTIAAASAYRQAEQALSVARRRGRVLVEHEELATGSVVPLLADDAVRAFADGMLRPLHEHDATGRGDLVASLRAWLAHHGQWDAAAADLGVHRHTLRYRMRRVEEILGRSLDDPDVRMELWLALKATSMP
ncbi:PucR family transcriptional regulator [Streptomyces sp. NBC_01306]|uniref:PucR family transcriptional regulator n=1 Tax=Streptomyces sp. NBC_01306 TaxID=2903819 RepID=UPI0022579FE6|nr:PucR family transcriptional regulator [Streptomyces sp. NBC_01306]MCX4723415.1 PucR family transcriptional regulator [Streptomyces sp. NBC_01306]